METDINALRESARQLVRELNLLEGRACCGELSLSESHFLLELGRAGEATAAELADRLVLDKSTVSRLCTRLQDKGLVLCCEPAGDRRRKPLRLSDTGVQELTGIDGVADAQVGNALQFIAAPERGQVVEGLARYARALHYARLARECTVRPIEAQDSPVVAGIIRQVMTEFGAVGCGYSIEDPEVDDMHRAYQGPKSAFWVIEKEGRILGCGGIGPLSGGDEDTCELRKMYFLPELRGTGMGTRLLNLCLQAARERGYRRCYLETLDSMHHARKLYARNGFQPLDGPLGATGHGACNTWMVRELD